MITTRHSRAAARACGTLVLLLAVGLAGAAAASTEEGTTTAAPGSYVGLRLSEALHDLQARGLTLIFTSRLVRPEMIVEVEPVATEPRRILDELLAPHGLQAQDGAGGTVVVVLADEADRGVPAIIGAVRARHTLEPLAAAAIRIVEPGVEVRSGGDGRFEVANLEPGVYTLEAYLRGFMEERVDEVAVAPGHPAEVLLALQPLPFVHDEIVVRPSRLSLLREEPVAPLSLSRGEIEALPHLGGDVFRALSLLPGIAANDFTAQFSVHGGRRDEVLIVLDGQELYDAFHLKDYDSALSIVAPEGLSSVSLTTGAFPAHRGDRMSGVLEMTTVTPSDRRRTRLSLSLLHALAAGAGTFRGERGTWLASARRGSIDLAARIFGHEDPSFWDLFGKVEFQLDERRQLRGHVLRAGDELDFYEAVEGEDKHFNTEYDSSYLWLTHQAVVGERTLVETSASWSRIDRDRRGVENEEEQSFEVLDQRAFDVVGLAHSWSLRATSKHALKWGFELRRYDADYDYLNDFDRSTPPLVPAANPIEPASGVPRFAGRFRGDYLGAYAADRFSPFEPLTVELGLRYDRHPWTDDTLWSPRVSVAWRLGESSVLRASWGRFSQSQRPYEVQVEDGETDFFPAERSEHGVLGYERLLGREGALLRALRLELYHRKIDNPRPRYENLFEPINTFPEVEPDRVHIAADRSSAEGIELVLRGSAGRKIDWWMSYAYARTEDRISGKVFRRQLDQPHTFNLVLHYRLTKRWDLNLAWRYHTGWPTTQVTLEEVQRPDGEPEPILVLGPLNAERLPSYHRMDLRASRRWQFERGQLLFFVDVQNLYDRRNLGGFDLEVDEDAGELITEGEHWPGTFPSVGIAWEF